MCTFFPFASRASSLLFHLFPSLSGAPSIKTCFWWRRIWGCHDKELYLKILPAKRTLGIYRMFRQIELFSGHEFSAFCHLILASTGLLLVVQEMACQKEKLYTLVTGNYLLQQYVADKRVVKKCNFLNIPYLHLAFY